MDGKETEYATQFFEFVPKSFVDELNEECNELISEALGVIKLKIMSKYEDKVPQPEIEESVGRVEDKYLLEVDNTFEKLSAFLTQNVLTIPSHVLLPEDEVWEDSRTSEVVKRMANTKSANETLRSRIKTAMYKKTMLTESLQTIRDICQKQESNIKSYDELVNNFNVSDWRDCVELTLENKRNVTKRLAALDEQSNLDPNAKTESLFTSRQQSINSKNCRRILDELQDRYNSSETEN